jgi:hypothetical protein
MTLERDNCTVKRKRLLAILQRRHHLRKIPPAPHGGGVVGAQAGLVDGQGALQQGAGGVEVALGVQDAGQVAEVGSGGGVLGDSMIGVGTPRYDLL